MHLDHDPKQDYYYFGIGMYFNSQQICPKFLALSKFVIYRSDEIWAWEGVGQAEVPEEYQEWWLFYVGNTLCKMY